jgi:serine/threonine protein kinase/Tfp pilus assembly protein PilF
MKCPECNFKNPTDTHFCSNCGGQLSHAKGITVCATETLQPPGKELTIGSVFAVRYQVIEELGKGGMATVYKVLDKEIKEKVALKLLKPEIADDQKTLERFRNELKLARQISHKNVCRMFDLTHQEGTYYITMEYVPGEDLKTSIKRMGPLSIGKTIFIAKQVCEGLAEAHRLGVVHRDLKPQNIMIDREGNARIMDFGIARSIKTKGITETGVIIGSPEYMSVEQVKGEEVDQRSDIYSLGVILYEMVTGKVPFEGDTPLSILVKHTTQAPSHPREINAEIPESLARVILKCLEKDKQKRYQSVGELSAELSNIEKEFPTTERLRAERKSSTTKELTVRVSLKKPSFKTLALVATSIILGAIIWQILPQKGTVLIPASKPSLAILYLENKSGDESLDSWRSGLAELFIADLSQSRFLHILSEKEIFSILKKLNLLEEKKYSPEDLEKVATHGRVDYILTGSFFTSGEDLIIIVMVRKPQGDLVISSRKVDCKKEEEIPAKIDELTKKIKSDLNLSKEQISSDRDMGLAKIITSSPEAYKYYIQGWENHLKGGDSHKTIEAMEKAIATDPEFAMAYKTMAEAYGDLDLISESWGCLQKALELKGRLSVRDFYLIQGELYAMSEKTYDKAIAAYNKLLEIYPEDWDGNFDLGTLFCCDLEQWDKAIERFRVLIQNHTENSLPYLNQAEAYMAKGMYDEAVEVLKNYLTSSPEEVGIREMLCNAYLCQGESDLALKEVEKALSIDSTSISPDVIGDIYYYRGDLFRAEKEYQRILDGEEPARQYDGWLRLAALYLSQGRFEKSKTQLRQSIALAEELGDTEQKMWSHSRLAYLHLASGSPEAALEEWEMAHNVAVEESLNGQLDLHLKGMIYLEMTAIDEAQKAADELKRVLQTGKNKKLMRYYHHLMGMIELEKQNFPEAIACFERALSMLPFQHSEIDDNVLFLYPLALAFYKAGNLEKTQEQYEKIISLTTGRLFFGDLFAKSIYMLGKIYQDEGWEGKAKEHYARFLELWKDADSGIPEVEDAKERLKKLRVES